MTPDAVLLLAIQLLFSLILMWSCFCRLVKTDNETSPPVRWAVVLELAAAGLVAGGPFAPYLMPADATWAPLTTPTILWVLLLCSVAMVHLVTARAWAIAAAAAALKRSQAAIQRWITTLGIAAAVAALFVLSPSTRVQAQELFTRLDKGQTVTCRAEAGCVGMSLETFREIAKAMQAGADCRKGGASI